jgi:hypothetical protein
MLNYVNLDARVRQLMLDEVDLDIRTGTLFVSPRLSNTGLQNYVTLLREAMSAHDDSWLAEQFASHGRLSRTEPRRQPSGGYTTARVPANAATTIAESEFNHFYIRALCRLALEQGVGELVIYRAKPVASPRPESQRLVGTRISAQALLDDLRGHTGTDTALGLPPGPNSGLSVRLPSEAESAIRPSVPPWA